MFRIEPEFEKFEHCWRGLPKSNHPLLPSRREVNPATFGELLHQTCLGEWVTPGEMRLFYAGSGFERNAGFQVTGQNYYSLLPAFFVPVVKNFHAQLFGTPCGAYVGDLVTTTTGGRHMHYTMHLPLTDDGGVPRYLLIVGLDRKPAGDLGQRAPASVGESSIKDLAYLDLGAGVPAGYVKGFVRHTGKAAIATSHRLCRRESTNPSGEVTTAVITAS